MLVLIHRKLHNSLIRETDRKRKREGGGERVREAGLNKSHQT